MAGRFSRWATSQEIDWDYDGPEIVADGIVHGLGLLFAVAATVALLGVLAPAGDAPALVALVVYCVTLLVTLAASASYNLWPISPTKWALRRLDHAMIFGLIAGTYTPFLVRLASWDAWLLLGLIWSVSLAGMAVKLIDVGKRERLATGLYIALGWSGVLLAGRLVGGLPASSLILLLVGGALYSGGTVFHHWRSLRFQNAIWHGFVLGGAACHWVAVTLTTASPPITA